MKVMIIGSGGREHALAHSIARSRLVDEVVAVPGNPGIAEEQKCRCVKLSDYTEMADFAVQEGIDLTVVGPEVPLVEGIADLFRARGLVIFGPGSMEARLEGSKQFAKEFMSQYGVATARYTCFDSLEPAMRYVEEENRPIVIKASGLCAGKGVTVCEDSREAKEALKGFMADRIFQDAGSTVVIEDCLRGPEVSVLAIYDGQNLFPMISAMDHKRLGAGDVGPNTGGMGTVAPAPYFSSEAQVEFRKQILEPTLKGLKDRNFRDPGCVFFGVILTADGPRLLEYNMRFGDPETQSVLTLLETDLFQILWNACHGNLSEEDFRFSEETAICLIGAAPGYPGSYKKDIELEFPENDRIKIYYAGIRKEGDRLYSSGGRIFGATAKGDPDEVRCLLNEYMETFRESGILWRNDIGLKH